MHGDIVWYIIYYTLDRRFSCFKCYKEKKINVMRAVAYKYKCNTNVHRNTESIMTFIF